jgi:nucleotide-binding universal stress UspA family protein
MTTNIDTLVVGTDFSATGRAALDWGIDLARSLGARVVVTHAYDLPLVGLLDASLIVDAETAARLSDEAQKGLDAEVARVRDRGVKVEGLLRQGDPRVVLPEIAQATSAGLLVVGSHGRRGVARALLGSVAESVLRASAVPVAVVREPARTSQSIEGVEP